MRHSVYAHDPLLHNPVLRRTVTRAVRALGITLGVLNVHLTLTRRGPRVIDVSPHLPGDLIPLLVKRATGIDLPGIAGDLCTGRIPHLASTRQRAAAIQFLYAPVTGRLHRLAVQPHADRHPLLDRIVLTQRIGAYVRSACNSTSSDRIAHFVVLGPDTPSCHSALDQAAQHIHADIVPSSIESTIPATGCHDDWAAV
ncbi:hypothetical protein AB0F03_36995 [Streptomyces sp. NPDC028722]|uniref:hypothetical protein n=1 Tax=Streptomyces sp. NPDC028722 TaxID=3155016 RepID=UPI0033DABB00